MNLVQQELDVAEQSPQEEKKLKRALKSRHLTMISIGGAIGTGLFLGSGASISQAGPGGALFAYAFIGAMVYFVMTSLGELSAFMPTSGAFSTYGSKFIDPAFGFAVGWTYWFSWAMTIAAGGVGKAGRNISPPYYTFLHVRVH